MQRLRRVLLILLALCVVVLGGARSARTQPAVQLKHLLPRAAHADDTDLWMAWRAALSGRVVDGYRAFPPTIAVAAPLRSVVTTMLRLVNTGTTTWRGAYGLRLVSGDAVGLPATLLLPDVAPGATVEIPLVVTMPGRLSGERYAAWAMEDAAGRRFGRPFRLSLRVATTAPTATPTSTPVPSAVVVPSASPTSTTALWTATPSPTARPTPVPPSPTARAQPSPSPTPTYGKAPTASATAVWHLVLLHSPTPTALLALPASPTETATPPAGYTATVTTSVSAVATVTTTPTGNPTTLVGQPLPTSSLGPGGWGGAGAAENSLLSTAHPRNAHISGHVSAVPPDASAANGAKQWAFGASPLDAHNRQDVALLNLGVRTAHVWLTVVTDDGRHIEAYVTVAGGRVKRLSVNALGDPAAHAALDLRSDVALVVERVTAVANALNEGTAGAVTPGWRPAAGVSGLARVPVFARELQRLTLFNPTARPATALLRLSSKAGPSAVRSLVVGAGAVRSLPSEPGPSGVVVSPVSGGSLVLDESTLYGQTDGLNALPFSPAAEHLYFAPTSLRIGGHSYLTLLNPGPTAASLVLRAIGAGGDPPLRLTVAAGSEHTVEPAVVLPHHAADRWLVVEATAPLFASRVTVLPPGIERVLSRAYVGSVAIPGSTATSRRIAFAAGDTRPLNMGVAETLFLLNPGSSASAVHVDYITQGGRAAAEDLMLGAETAATLMPATMVGQTIHGVVVESSVPLATAMLWQFNGGVYATESLGVPLDATSLQH